MNLTKKMAFLLAVSVLMASFTACGASSPKYESVTESAAMDYVVEESFPEEEFAVDDAVMLDEEAGILSPDNGTAVQMNQQENRKIIWTVNMNLETQNMDELLTGFNTQIEAVGGYVEYSSVRGRSQSYDSNRRAEITARVPSDKLDSFLEQMGTLATVTHSDRQREDITFQYTDTANRVKSLRSEPERLFELMEQATDLESIILLEQRLTEVRSQIENYTSMLNLYDNQVSYSTVYLYICEVGHVSGQVDNTISSRITTGLSDTMYDLKTGAEDWLVFTVVNLPVFAVWGIIIAVAVVIVKKFRKRFPHRQRTQTFPSTTTEIKKEEVKTNEKTPS